MKVWIFLGKKISEITKEKKIKHKRLSSEIQEPGPSGLNYGGITKVYDNPLKAIAPKLDYGLDLKYWGEKVEPAEIPRNEIEGYWSARDQE